GPRLTTEFVHLTGAPAAAKAASLVCGAASVQVPVALVLGQRSGDAVPRDAQQALRVERPDVHEGHRFGLYAGEELAVRAEGEPYAPFRQLERLNAGRPVPDPGTRSLVDCSDRQPA